MPTQTFEAAKNAGHDNSNIRKILEQLIFARKYSAANAAITEAVWDGTGFVGLEGFECVGLTTDGDGASWTRDQDVAEVTSHGYGEPTRRDIKKDAIGLTFVAQETNKTTLELDKGQSLDGIKPGANGTLTIDKATKPGSQFWEFLAIGKDGDGPDAVFVLRWLPRAQVTENGEQKWSPDDELRTEVTISAFVDKRVGTSMREIWAGPGLDHEAMGFPKPTP